MVKFVIMYLTAVLYYEMYDTVHCTMYILNIFKKPEVENGNIIIFDVATMILLIKSITLLIS